MATALLSITLVAHLLVPIALASWVGFSRTTSRAYWIAVLATATAYLVVMQVAGAGWHWFGFHWTYLFWAALSTWGLRARGLLPEDLAAYEVYGKRVVAPCRGEVLATRDGLADQTPPQMDDAHPAGNYVAVYCAHERVTVVLAHLENGSLRVGEGEEVDAGQAIARVGNSGNTSEPHLHVHAVRGRERRYERLLWNGDGCPVLFDGRFFVRNDRYEVR